ncbi:pyruvate carboxyltransferase [Streptomyces sp. CB03238]|uniref:LeuA family protein n=1 Tax=Streptomyces sp. CB03238 TaxID=1907777 RepID=UPI000A116915|nr:pyruvate carboxyltransferase [Streptomyces sp. CB03238]ORT57434.1 pyruvate carboxyltransferase [Streptomyces sp. CB03238]
MSRNNQARRVSVFDTTLRDGEQAPGNAMSPDQKLEIALAIESLGVDVIETGFPSSSRSDFEATKRIAGAVTTARIATLNRAVREDVRLAVEAGGRENHHVQIMATGSETHLTYKRGISQAEAQAEVIDAIRYGKALGAQHITLGIEDASRGSDALLRPLIEASIEAGADCVALADTTGCLIPEEYGAQVGRVRGWIGADITLGVHCHEDLGLSLANALAGVRAGADEVQATVAGIGERAGNTALEELLAVLTYKGEELGVFTTATTKGLYEVYELLCWTIGLQPVRNKAIFGVNAFATQAGIHQAGMLRDPITYEYVQPADFGRERAILVGRHSGRTVLRHLLEELKVEADDVFVDSVYETYVENRTNGECITLDELRVILAGERATEVVA